MLMNTIYTLVAIAVAILLIGQLGLLRGQMPHDLGVRDSRFKPLPKTPNAVSSQFDDDAPAAARIRPLDAQGLDPNLAMTTLGEILRDTDGLHVITQRTDYIYAQAQSRWLQFVDDVEFWYDAQTQTIAVRSASRIGRSDLGVNRQRVEGLRAEWVKVSESIPKLDSGH